MGTNRRGTRLLLGCLVCALLLTPVAGATDGGGRTTENTRAVSYSIAVTAGNASPGETVTVELTVANEGSTVAESVRAEAHLRRPGASEPVGWSVVNHTDGGSQFGDRGLVWQWESLDPGQNATTSVTLRVPANASAGEVTVSGRVSDRSRNQAIAETTLLVGESDDSDETDDGDSSDDSDDSDDGDSSDDGGDGSDGTDGDNADDDNADDDSGGLQPGDGEDGSSDDSGSEGEDDSEDDDTADSGDDDATDGGLGEGDGGDTTTDAGGDGSEGKSESDSNTTKEEGTSAPEDSSTETQSTDDSAGDGSTGDDAETQATADGTESKQASAGGTDTESADEKAGSTGRDSADGGSSNQGASDGSTVIDNPEDSVEFLSVLDPFATPVEHPETQDFNGVFGLVSFICMGTLVARRIQ
ncbi:NEW3 domain-containing protein [Haloarchaeobius sp. HME9146]|uniref:NEW3 domain-containing protein n=1 Tax=Haloarchaeobius sp. HME9146 TaxID=2978732 RepID=UPI0021C15023|nr:NEW3 domain-containing protein [Haloarchaeobius sp. HME9146]MCT9096084.1 NEW3 domain-containing protein [Haloarchaeobius sp. HME9146]